MLSYLRAFGCRCFMLNNGKDDLGKFDPSSDEGVFVGYSSSRKAYRIFNKRTQCIEESIYVVFDEDGIWKNDGSNDDDDVMKLFKSKKTEGGEADADQQLKNDCDDKNHSLPEEAVEVEKGDMVPGTTQNSIQGTSDSPENDVTLDEEEHADQPNQSAPKSGWKHSSSHPLNNLISPLNFGIHTRSKTRNLVAFSAFISSIEPKNVKEALGDADWINSMQEELHQFERIKVRYLVPRPEGRTVIGTRWVFRNKLDENGVITRNKSRLVVQGYN